MKMRTLGFLLACGGFLASDAAGQLPTNQMPQLPPPTGVGDKARFPIVGGAKAKLDDVSGEWKGTITTSGSREPLEVTLTLKQEGLKLSGSISSAKANLLIPGDNMPIEGKIRGDELIFSTSRGVQRMTTFSLQAENGVGGQLKLTGSAKPSSGLSTNRMEVEFSRIDGPSGKPIPSLKKLPKGIAR